MEIFNILIANVDSYVGPTFHQATILGGKATTFCGNKKPEKLHSAGRILAQDGEDGYKVHFPLLGTCFQVMQPFKLEA